jgi:hypothetical protein
MCQAAIEVNSASGRGQRTLPVVATPSRDRERGKVL